MRYIRRISIATALTAALLAVACGGSDGTDEVTEAVRTAMTSGDSVVCTDLMTPAYIHQVSGLKGEEAVSGCEEDVEERAGSREVSVENVEVSGDRATAEAALTARDHPLDGQTIELELLDEGERWKLDRVRSFVSFDREAFLAGFAARVDDLREQERWLSPVGVACVANELEQADDADLQALYLEPDSPYDQVWSACAFGRDNFLATLRQDAETSADHCVIDALEEELVDEGPVLEEDGGVRTKGGVLTLDEFDILVEEIELLCTAGDLPSRGSEIPDRETYLTELRRGLRAGGFSKAAADCFVDEFEKLDDPELLGGPDASEAAVERAVRKCPEALLESARDEGG